MDAVLPLHSLSVFPVQHFSRAELWTVARRGSTGDPDRDTAVVRFSNSFMNPRPQPDGSVQLHRAADIMAPTGVPIFSTTSGTVATSWRPSGVLRPGVGSVTSAPLTDGGNYVVIVDDTEGRYHYYAHMEHPPLVSIQQSVRAGQLLGFVGNTGTRAQHGPPHLHYQVTTRTESGAASTFWNPHFELVRLANLLGGTGAGQTRIEFDDFSNSVREEADTGLVDPWTGQPIPDLVHPWDDAFD